MALGVALAMPVAFPSEFEVLKAEMPFEWKLSRSLS